MRKLRHAMLLMALALFASVAATLVEEAVSDQNEPVAEKPTTSALQ